MKGLHIYVARSQPATHYVDRSMGGRAMHFRNSPRRQMRCHLCGRLRWAKHLRVQVYYDGTNVFCAPGRGCKRRV